MARSYWVLQPQSSQQTVSAQDNTITSIKLNHIHILSPLHGNGITSDTLTRTHTHRFIDLAA